MSICRKCGESIRFERKQGKWWPVHDWDRCKSIVRARDGWEPKTVVVTEAAPGTVFYEGAVPPWDESL